MFVSILVHEMGHAVAFRGFGDTPRITLHVFGGHPTKTLPVGKEVVAAVAGSAAGLVVLGLPAYALRASLDPIDLESYRWWIVLSKDAPAGTASRRSPARAPRAGRTRWDRQRQLEGWEDHPRCGIF